MSFKVASSPNQLGFCVISPSNSTPHPRSPSMDKMSCTQAWARAACSGPLGWDESSCTNSSMAQQEPALMKGDTCEEVPLSHLTLPGWGNQNSVLWMTLACQLKGSLTQKTL